MKLSDSIKYSFLKTIRDKKNVYFIIILVICCLLATSAISFSIAFFSHLDKTLNSNVSSRSLIITINTNMFKSNPNLLDEKLNEIKALKHVIEVPQGNSFVAVDVEDFRYGQYDGRIELVYGSENTLPKNIIGERFSSKDTGVIICPINFYPGSTLEYPKKQKKIFIDGYDLLNKTIEIQKVIYEIKDEKVIKMGKFKKNFKVIGLYDPSDIDGWIFQCFAPGKDIDEIYEKTMGSLYNEDAESLSIPSSIVIVDEYENTKTVKNELIAMGFDVNYVTEQNISYQRNIKITCIFVVFISIIGIIFTTMSYIRKKNINQTYDFGIMKSIGYQGKNITIIYVLQTSIIIVFSYIISMLIYILGLEIIKIKIKQYLIFTGHSFYFNQYSLTYILSFFIILVLPIFFTIFFTMWFTHKKNNTSAMSMLMGDKQ